MTWARARWWVAGALAVLALAVIVWRADEASIPVPAVAAPAPVAVRSPDSGAPVPMAPAPPAVDAGRTAAPIVEDAGAPRVLLEVEVLLDGRHHAGETVYVRRLAPRGPDGFADRPVDVMGFARFELGPGEWVVECGDTVERVQLVRDPVHVRLLMVSAPQLSVRVIDTQGAPVPDATLHFDRLGFRTNWEGRVRFETRLADGWLWALTSDSVSPRYLVRPPADVTLVLERAGTLRVEAAGGCGGWVRIERGQQLIGEWAVDLEQAQVQWPPPEPRREELLVPTGVLSVTLRSCDVHNRLSSAAGQVTVGPGDRASLKLTPRPIGPITGVARLDGQPWPGVSLAIVGVRGARLTNSITGRAGSFSFDPGGLRPPGDPVLEVVPEGDWHFSTRGLVRLGDAPLQLDLVRGREDAGQAP